MPIHLNGNDNPLEVSYNGTSLESVWASTDGGAHTYEVWRRDTAGPESFSIGAVVASNNSAFFFRNMTYDTDVMFPDGTRGIRYSGDATFETTFSSGIQVGPTLPYSADYVWATNENGTTFSFAGMPSQYKFHSAWSTSAISNCTFDVYQNDSHPGELRPSDRVTMYLTSKINLTMSGSNILSSYITTDSLNKAWPVLTATTSWTYQGTCKLIVKRT